jgi:CPW-WPC domain-containing protein
MLCVAKEILLSGILVGVLIGCGPDLTRPGYKPPPSTTTRSPIVVFQDAETDLLSSMRFDFPQKNFRILNGISSEINRVIKTYPPGAISHESNQSLQLRIQGLIGEVFSQYIASRGFDARDMECTRDYSRLCPPGWIDVGDGQVCESPPALFEDESCRQVSFGGLTPREKSDAAFACQGSVYPCKDACLSDYSQPCPDGWIPRNPGSAVCKAPETYIKPCVNLYDFTDHNSKMKSRFEQTCKVKWPCKRPASR